MTKDLRPWTTSGSRFRWSDGTDIVHATVAHELNQDRMKWCPPTNVGGRYVRTS